MEYAFKKINIQSPFPTTSCGHSCQVEKLFDYHDPLYARIFSFKDQHIWIIHFSFDLLAFDLKHRNELQDYFRTYYQNDNIHVITSATHTHYANSVRDQNYVDYLCALLKKECADLTYRQIDDVKFSYQHMHSTAIGKSRISGYETGKEELCLIRFYEKEKNFFTIVYYNCHPTILKAETPYFSSEYPGYVLKRLEEEYPQCDFSFLQGAAGDISSRFTRDGQDYDALIRLSEKLLQDLSLMMKKETEKFIFNPAYKEEVIRFEHEFTPIDLSLIRNDLSPREMETIRLGQIERTKLENKSSEIFSSPIEEAIISCLDLNGIKVIFFPNEIFSAYMEHIDLNKQMLVSYSNGYGAYVLPIGFQYITYEMFTDTLTNQAKEKIIETIQNI